MRKSHYLLPLLAATAVAACSSYEETTDPATAGSRSLVKIHADVADKGGTRANIVVGETSFTAHWESGDALGIAYSAPGTSAYRGPERFTYDGGAFAFEGELPIGRGDWQYRAFYPHAPLTGTTASVPFGNLRTQRGNAFNCAADALVAETLDFSNAAQGMTDDGEPIRFRLGRLTSILNLNLTGGSPDDRVRSVLLTSHDGEPISAASFDFDISRMGEDAALSAAGRSEVIALNFEPGTAPGSDAMSAFFNVAPGNYSELTFEVITESKKINRVSVLRSDPDNPFVAGKLYKKEISAAGFTPLAAPSLDWPGQDMDAVHEITTDESGLILDYSAAIDILTPGGIASLAVDIVSPALNGLGLSRLDLFNDTELPGLGILYEDLGLSSGVEVQYRKSCVFDITGLVPLIAMLPGADPGSLHTFEVVVTDLAGQTTTQKLTFRIPGATIRYDDNADLWANTASLSISGVNPAAQSVVLQYRAEGETAWNTALTTPTGEGSYKAAIAPSWSESTNAAGLTVHTVDPKTGIFARKNYQYLLLVDGQQTGWGTFTPSGNGGDVIPNNDMGSWSTRVMKNLLGKDVNVPYPNGSGSAFWGCGNNGITTDLCTQDQSFFGAGTSVAKLKSKYMFILAAGNLFTGDFDYANMSGTVKFGKDYDWTARPTRLRFKYHATVGAGTFRTKHKDPATGAFPITSKEQDAARVFVAIVDWDATQNVKSGTISVSGTWDPVSMQTLPGVGNIIGYGSMMIRQSTQGTQLVQGDIPIQFYDPVTKPSKAYKIVISCAANAYGDYMCGCQDNVLYVDDFEWVY